MNTKLSSNVKMESAQSAVNTSDINASRWTIITERGKCVGFCVCNATEDSVDSLTPPIVSAEPRII